MNPPGVGRWPQHSSIQLTQSSISPWLSSSSALSLWLMSSLLVMITSSSQASLNSSVASKGFLVRSYLGRQGQNSKGTTEDNLTIGNIDSIDQANNGNRATFILSETINGLNISLESLYSSGDSWDTNQFFNQTGDNDTEPIWDYGNTTRLDPANTTEGQPSNISFIFGDMRTSLIVIEDSNIWDDVNSKYIMLVIGIIAVCLMLVAALSSAMCARRRLEMPNRGHQLAHIETEV